MTRISGRGALMRVEAVAPGALGAYRAAASRVFLSKADAEVPNEVLEALPAAKAAFAGPAAERLTETATAALGEAPRAVAFLPRRGTFHAVFRIEISEDTCFYARTSVPTIPWPAIDFALDVWISETAPRQGVPVPVVRYVDLSRTRTPFDVEIAEAGPGEPLASGPGADDAVRALGATAARIHALACRGFGPLDPASLGAERAPAGLHETWRDYVLLRLDEHLAVCRHDGALTDEEAGAIRGALVEAEPLLAQAPSVLLHGDLGSQNVLVRDGRVTAVIDWEDSLAGDPMFDIACWGTFVGNHERLEVFLAGYRTVCEVPADYELRYWLYFIRIMLAKTVHRSRFGYARTDRIPAAARLRPALEALCARLEAGC